jgi:hypothetical protein
MPRMTVVDLIARSTSTGRGSVTDGLLLAGLGLFVILFGQVMARVPDRRAPTSGWQSGARRAGDWLWTKGMTVMGVGCIAGAIWIIVRA